MTTPSGASRALLDFLGVAQTTGPGKTFDWASRPSAMPLVTAGQHPVFADDRAAFDALSQTNLDLRQVVFLPLEPAGASPRRSRTAARVLDARFANQSISIQTVAPAASLVVISQTYYPAWKAYVDGRPAKLWRANYAFQALEVPAGRHQSGWLYQDKQLLAGAVLSGLGLLACAGLWVLAQRSREWTPEPPADLISAPCSRLQILAQPFAAGLVPPQLGDWLSPGRFALALAVLIFAAFPQVLLGLQTFVVRDFGFFGFPLAHYQRECFWRGQLPLWNPYNNCGVPFLAQWNTMPLYPPALIYLLLAAEWSLSFFSLRTCFGPGWACIAWRSDGPGNRLAAAVAGLIFAFNGLSLNLLMWPSHIATLSWMPWVVLTVERAWEEGGDRLHWPPWSGALQMLAGGPETILFTWLILLALWASRAWRVFRPRLEPQAESAAPSEPSPPLAALWRFPLVVALVAALAAVQLLPFLDLAAHSQRDPGFADARWSMPAWGWVNFLVPMVYGSVWNKGVFFQYHQAWTSSYYLGVGGLLLALLGVWVAPQRRRTWLLAVAGALGLALAMGDQLGPCSLAAASGAPIEIDDLSGEIRDGGRVRRPAARRFRLGPAADAGTRPKA